jgi:hypothetical protein
VSENLYVMNIIFLLGGAFVCILVEIYVFRNNEIALVSVYKLVAVFMISCSSV